MTNNFDRWFFAPLDQQDEYAKVCENYMYSENFETDLNKWLAENPEKTESDYYYSVGFDRAVERYQDYLSDAI